MRMFLHPCLLIVAGPMMLGGCASFDLVKPAPPQPQPINVVYSGEGPSGWTDLPIGAYRVPESQVVISGYQKGNIGFLFGVVGVAMQDAVQTEIGRSAVSNVRDALRVELTGRAQRISELLIGSGQFGEAFSTTPRSGAPVLAVNPYVVITYVNDTEVRPFAILKATLRGPANNTLWTSRYIASAGKELPLEGDQSFTADNGALLQATIAKDLETAIKFMLADVAAPRIRDERKLIYVETRAPFMKQRLGMVGYEIGEDDGSVVFAPKIGDGMVFAGVQILDKSVTTFRAATTADKFHVLE